MFVGFGTLVNAVLILVGSTLGLYAKRYIPERLKNGITHAIGVFTILLGIKLLIENRPEILKIFFLLIFGGGIGYMLRLEERIEKLSGEKKSGFLTASLLFTIGPMTFMGCFLEATKGDSSLLVSKAFMDGISSTILSSIFGKGVLLSTFYVLVFQGALTLGFYFLGDFVKPQSTANALFLGGGLLVVLGLKILELLNHVKLINFLPSLLLSLAV
ncbi:DUF554 family protein [Thermocrinis sp.]